jgi:nucleotide-binding universal stress UspA family protein
MISILGPDATRKRLRLNKRDKIMSKATIIVGLDGGEAGNRALTFACGQAKLIGDCALKLVYVIEWSPFSFQTSEENEQRHKRREEELSQARTRIMDPAVKEVTDSGLAVEGIVRHGDVADILDDMAKKHSAQQIVVGRVGLRGLKERMFGGVTGRLAVASSVPVTIIP